MSRTFVLLIFESAQIYLCGLVAVYIRFAGQTMEVLVHERGWLKLVLSAIVVQGSFYLFDLCDFPMIRMRSLLVIRVFQSLGLSAIILALIFYIAPRMLVGRNVFFVHLLLTLVTMTCWCMFAMRLLGTTRLAERVLIVGTNRNAI